MKNIIAFAIIVLLYSCSHRQTPSEATHVASADHTVVLTDSQMTNAGITVGRAITTRMSETLRVNGVVDVPPQNLISVSVPTGGYLKSTKLLPGMPVHKGEEIAVIENEVFIQMQQNYLAAQARSEYLQKEYARQRDLNATQATSDKIYEQVTSDYKQQQAELNALREKLRLVGIDAARLTADNISRSIRLVSPIDGYVSAVNVNIGKFVNPTDILFELVNPTDLHLALTIFEKDMPYITKGLKVRAYPVNDPGKVFTAETILTGKKLDESRSSIVHCHFTSPTHELLPGMFLNANIELPERDGYAVPDDAIIRSGDSLYLFRADGRNMFTLVQVHPLLSKDSITMIAPDGLDLPHQQFILKGAYAAYMQLANKKEED
ncbi:MAG: efflux RND transporter periplasmic adaptor subunit [Bacteroidetes bacterium]|nr:efflux RND transporter periplasmic adaptor subunit [Bacteroidota bacterium]